VAKAVVGRAERHVRSHRALSASVVQPQGLCAGQSPLPAREPDGTLCPRVLACVRCRVPVKPVERTSPLSPAALQVDAFILA